jgi:nucleoid DNA-binding protein
MVKELILDNDRVVLPGLGSFVAEVVPATFSDKGYTINPPYRKLYFRSRPDAGDELAAFYAKSNSVPEDVAQKVIAAFVSELKSVLFVKKTVIFPGLGRLRATKENNVFFVSDEDLDIYPEGFGLQPISLKTHEETREEVSAAVVGLKSILEDPVVADPDPVVEPKPVTEPEPVEEPIAEPELVIESEPTPDILVEPVSFPEPAPVPDPSPVSAPLPVPDPVPVPEKVSVQEPVSVPEKAKKTRTVMRTIGRVVIWTVVALAVALAAYVAVGHLCPEWLDSILYTPEELEIIRGK